MKHADQILSLLKTQIGNDEEVHQHIERLLRRYKDHLAGGLRSEPKDKKTIDHLQTAFESLAQTHEGLRARAFDELVNQIAFFSPGIVVKLVNGETDEDVAVRSPYNLFVGGNKLGRGVTIKNLLVSYYGRNPKKPQADTVLQHARMYGYASHKRRTWETPSLVAANTVSQRKLRFRVRGVV